MFTTLPPLIKLDFELVQVTYDLFRQVIFLIIISVPKPVQQFYPAKLSVQF
jgi:hypothetical protein